MLWQRYLFYPYQGKIQSLIVRIAEIKNVKHQQMCLQSMHLLLITVVVISICCGICVSMLFGQVRLTELSSIRQNVNRKIYYVS